MQGLYIVCTSGTLALAEPTDTSKRMLEAEVAIMTDVIKHLNQKGIEVLYVYDALLCEEKDKPVVIETMNRIILEYGVKSSVKAVC